VARAYSHSTSSRHRKQCSKSRCLGDVRSGGDRDRRCYLELSNVGSLGLRDPRPFLALGAADGAVLCVRNRTDGICRNPGCQQMDTSRRRRRTTGKPPPIHRLLGDAFWQRRGRRIILARRRRSIKAQPQQEGTLRLRPPKAWGFATISLRMRASGESGFRPETSNSGRPRKPHW